MRGRTRGAFGQDPTWSSVGAAFGGAALGAIASTALSTGVQEVTERNTEGEASTQSSGRTRFQGGNPPGYRTAGEAAFTALERIVPKSVAENTEYGGLIYRQGGRYFATEAVSGTEGNVNVWEAQSMVPEGATIVGDYHTHPGTVEGYSQHEWFRNGETFSGTDEPYMHSDSRALVSNSVREQSDYWEAKGDLARRGVDAKVFTSFLSTPSGRFGIYNVKADRIFYFSPTPRLLAPGRAVPIGSYAYH